MLHTKWSAGVLVVFALLIGAVTSSAGQANTLQERTPQAALEQLFTSDHVEEQWFAPPFLEQVSRDEVAQLVEQLRLQLGRYESVERREQQFEVVFARGFVPAQIALDGDGQIAGLFFGPPRARVGELSDAISQFQQLPGEVSLFVSANAKELAGLQADTPLAVGSAFKLAVLATLQHEVETGQLRWDDVVTLKEEWMSAPSGVLQTWPVSSPLTVHTLAAQMISISDNTATDALIHLIERDAIERVAPENRPFLTTREATMLKSIRNGELLQRYRASGVEARRTLLADMQSWPLPAPNELPGEPHALDVEWFFSVRELCGLMEQVRELPLMSINAGVADASEWNRVAFKGGSEPGVFNLTTWLAGQGGAHYCVAATWNDAKALDEAQFLSLYGGLLELLHEMDVAGR